MESYDSLVKALICGEYPEMSCSRCSYGSPAYCDRDKIMHDAAAAIEALQAEVKDLNEALKAESEARQNAETKRYCCNCAHMDASMYDEAWYGICKLNDFEVEAIHGWGCTDWAKMEVQE